MQADAIRVMNTTYQPASFYPLSRMAIILGMRDQHQAFDMVTMHGLEATRPPSAIPPLRPLPPPNFVVPKLPPGATPPAQPSVPSVQLKAIAFADATKESLQLFYVKQRVRMQVKSSKTDTVIRTESKLTPADEDESLLDNLPPTARLRYRYRAPTASLFTSYIYEAPSLTQQSSASEPSPTCTWTRWICGE